MQNTTKSKLCGEPNLITDKRIDTTALAQEANASTSKEAYQLLEKTLAYRIGVGARANSPSSSFFVEIVINLSIENGAVDLSRLERILACLKALKSSGYSLTYDAGGWISCETSNAVEDPNEEYCKIKTLINAASI